MRNRSHAFEVLLANTFDSETKQAVILASGEGTHMRPFTYEIPKPLIPVNGKPILEHTINALQQYGITNIVITVSHLADKIIEHFGDGANFGVQIKYVKEKKPSGTAGALASAQKSLQPGPFLMLYGDILLDLDLLEFLRTHKQYKSAVGTLALTSIADPSSYGAVKMRGNKIVEFSEKPPVDRRVSHLIFAGVGAFDATIFSLITKKKKGTLSLEKDVFPLLIKKGTLYGYPFEGQWFDVSTPETYEHVLKHWHK